jgi:hypothetical protein
MILGNSLPVMASLAGRQADIYIDSPCREARRSSKCGPREHPTPSTARLPCTLLPCATSRWKVEVKNITLSADERLIEAARERARSENTTLNEQFRLWLAAYGRRQQRVDDAMAVADRIRTYASSGGRTFTRDEMNER